MNPVCVITTINPPSPAVLSLAARCPDRVIVVGDTKTPNPWSTPGVDFYSTERQNTLGLSLVPRLKINHYARKNIGYLLAMRADAECIYDTDDDNVPSVRGWRGRALSCSAQTATRRGWCNVYRYFHPSDIWPRGFGLSKLKEYVPELSAEARVDCPIQQGLADGEPDVDAIWRLAAVPSKLRGRSLFFNHRKSVMLAPGVWCPFNSQTTWWFKEAYPLLYLPTYATFRMTDIWRSFVAQRCLWALGHGVAFHSPAEVEQSRNEHDLMKDFADEIPGYLANEQIVATLDELILTPGADSITSNLVRCYVALVRARFLPADELDALRAWVDDVENIRRGGT